MGLCISQDCAPIPAQIVNQVLQASIGAFNINIPVPAVGSQTFPMQTNMYSDGEVFCYLFNAKYKVIMWYDGTGLIITLDGFIVKPFSFDNSLLSGLHVSYRHCGYLNVNKQSTNLYLFHVTENDCVISPIGYPMSCTLSLYDNQLFIESLLSEYPTFTIQDNTLKCIGSDKFGLFVINGVVSTAKDMYSIV